MRYTGPIHKLGVDDGDTITMRYHKLIVYVQDTARMRARFLHVMSKLAKDDSIVWDRTDDNGMPLPCQDDDVLAYYVHVRDSASYAMGLMEKIGVDEKSVIANQYRAENAKRPILNIHYCDTQGVPYGMGKLSGMQQANRKLVDDNRGKDTVVQHGKPFTHIKGKPASPTTTFNAHVRELNEQGEQERKIILPIVTQEKKTKHAINQQLRVWTKEQQKELMERCRQYDLEHCFAYSHYFTQDKETYTFDNMGGI